MKEMNELPDWLQKLWKENSSLARKAEKEIDRLQNNTKLISEAVYLLRKYQPDNCPNWVENVGDCKKEICEFCRFEKCIEALENNKKFLLVK